MQFGVCLSVYVCSRYVLGMLGRRKIKKKEERQKVRKIKKEDRSRKIRKTRGRIALQCMSPNDVIFSQSKKGITAKN